MQDGKSTAPDESDRKDISHDHIIKKHARHPPGISEIIGYGGGGYIGAIDDSTVLKYPHVPGENDRLHVEAQLLEILGNHPRIIAFKGLTEHGLILQRASNGSLLDYITSQPSIPLEQRLRWCQQAAEAVSYIHGKHVIHCDISLRNILLDENLDLLLADFQGVLKSADGSNTTILDGFSRECSKSFMPRPHGDYVSVKTDLFALGSAIYFIITGQEVFPDLDNWEDDEEILARFEKEEFPTDSHLCSHITEKCWKQQYESADDVLSDLLRIQARP